MEIEDALIELCYHMQGSLTWTEAWLLSPYQRRKMIRFLNKRYKEEREAITGREQM